VTGTGSARHNFGPAGAGERTVFGASRPGYDDGAHLDEEHVDAWVAFMQANGIQRAVCLLEDGSVTEHYRRAFGHANVLHAPVPDFTIPPEDQLRAIISFLRAADGDGARVIVHCAAGIGRTAVVLAAWLVAARGLPVDEAVDAVRETAKRDPYEAAGKNGVTKASIRALLAAAAPT